MENILEELERVIYVVEDLLSYAQAYGKGNKERAIKAVQNREIRQAAKNELKNGTSSDYLSAVRKILDRRNSDKTIAGKQDMQGLKSGWDKEANKKENKKLTKEFKEAKRNIKKQKKEDIRQNFENLYRNKKATEQAQLDHADAQIKKGLSEACIEDILSLVEEYINEVSMKRWKKAAENSIPYRQADVDKKTEKYEDNDEDEDAFQDMEFAKDRLAYAEIVANEAPKSRKPANLHYLNGK